MKAIAGLAARLNTGVGVPLRAHARRRWRRYLLLLLLLALPLCAYRNAVRDIAEASMGRLYADAEVTPARRVGLVLGTSKQTADGHANLFFAYRMDAAANLYHAGKLEYLLVSGDNHGPRHNEPAQMRAALLARGVPARAIYCDYAGITTLDSVARARQVFGITDNLTIISQGFHNQRALYLARHHGIDAIGFNARDVDRHYATRTLSRERISRLRAWWDVRVIEREPRHRGAPVGIGSSTSSCAGAVSRGT